MANKLVINGNFLNRRISGVERYGVELSKRLLKKDNIKVAARPESLNLKLLELENKESLILTDDFYAKYIKKGWVHFSLPRFLEKSDILWTPDNIGPLVNNQVLTIHDMAVHDFPSAYSPKMKLAYRFLLPIQVKKSIAIITVSEFSRQRILSYFPDAESKIKIIQNAVDIKKVMVPAHNKDEMLRSYGIDRPYFLTLSTLEQKKNLHRLLEAWTNLDPNLREEHQLVIVGGSTHTFAAMKFDLDSLFKKNVVFTGYVNEDHLFPLYSGALSFVYPSLYEGFGLTVLEAASCGVPVLTSRGTAMQEVMGDSAEYFDPLNVESITSEIQSIIEGKYDLKLMRENSLNCAKQYSWDKAATSLWQFFSQL